MDIQITEDYVGFEIAELLKEKGFNELCFALYNPSEKLIQCGVMLNNTQVGRVEGSYSAPTLQMAMKWLREVHKIGIFPRQYHIYKEKYDDFGYGVEIIKLGTDTPLNPSRENMPDKDRYFISLSHEEACEAAIKYCLENLI